MPKKKPKTGKPQLHKDLEGFEVNINEFGEITSTMDIQKINEFLNKNVDDKKFKEREDEEETEDEERRRGQAERAPAGGDRRDCRGFCL